ncbi:MAG: TVP38/TMEM64 family protein [Solirubrobacterales bacterium]
MGVGDRKGSGEERPPLTGVAITLAGIAVLAAIVLAIPALRHGVENAINGDTSGLRHELHGLGGVLLTVALALVHVVVWYPAEILDTAVGYVHGFPFGFPLVMACWVLNAVIAYWVGHNAARPLLYRIAGRERFERYEELVHRGGTTLLLGMRMVPVVPFSLFSYVAGAARVPLGRFVWTTAVGYIPITAVFVYVGSQLESLSATDPLLWIGAAVLIVLLLVSHRLSGFRGSRQPPEPPPRSPPSTATRSAASGRPGR